MFRRIMLGVAYLTLPFLAYACSKVEPNKPETTQPSGIEEVIKPEDRTLTAAEIDAKIKDAVDSAVWDVKFRAEFDAMDLRGEIRTLKRYIENMDKLRTQDAEIARKIHKEIYHPESQYTPKPFLDFPEPVVVNGVPDTHLAIIDR